MGLILSIFNLNYVFLPLKIKKKHLIYYKDEIISGKSSCAHLYRMQSHKSLLYLISVGHDGYMRKFYVISYFYLVVGFRGLGMIKLSNG